MKFATLLCALVTFSTPVFAEPEPADLLARLFTTVIERQQIDRERHHALTGEAMNEEIPQQDPDIFYKAVLFRQGLEPLLWINNRKGTLSHWQSRVDRLVVQQLWLDGDLLSVILDGKTWQLKPNQVLNRQSHKVTEAYDYQPVLLKSTVPVIGTDHGVTPAGTTEGTGVAGKTGALELMKKAVELRQRSSQGLIR